MHPLRRFGALGVGHGPMHSRLAAGRRTESRMSDAAQRGDLMRRITALPQFSEQAAVGRIEGRQQRRRPYRARFRR